MAGPPKPSHGQRDCCQSQLCARLERIDESCKAETLEVPGVPRRHEEPRDLRCCGDLRVEGEPAYLFLISLEPCEQAAPDEGRVSAELQNSRPEAIGNITG